MHIHMMYIIEIFNIKTQETFKMFSSTNDIEVNREILRKKLNSSEEDIKRTFLFKNSIHLPNTKFAYIC